MTTFSNTLKEEKKDILNPAAIQIKKSFLWFTARQTFSCTIHF